MIKFIFAAIWICAATIGAVFYAFQSSSAKPAAEEKPAFFGGLDYVKTDVLSIPLLKDGRVNGYFIARFVYTVEPEKLRKLSVPAASLMADEAYSYLFSNPRIDFSRIDDVDIDALRNGIRDGINGRIGEKLIHDVLVEQIDYLSKSDIRDNSLRRRKPEESTDTKPAEQATAH
jgi:hypothetical protein